MAAWQVDFYLIPRRALAASDAKARPALSTSDWWANTAFPSDYQRRLTAIAAAEPTSVGGVDSWGPEEGNRIDVWTDGGRVRRVMVRVDVRRLDSRFGAALLDFVRLADAVLVRSDGFVIEPTIGAYAGSLRNSGAWKFASDPATFLASQAMNDEDDE